MSAGETNVFPYLPITLSYQDCIFDALGLLDTGSGLNVLPYHVGLALGVVLEGTKTFNFLSR